MQVDTLSIMVQGLEPLEFCGGKCKMYKLCKETGASPGKYDTFYFYYCYVRIREMCKGERLIDRHLWVI